VHGRRHRYAAAASSVPASSASDGLLSSSTSSDVPPAELTGAVKWTTVKITDSEKPTTDSIFLGADEVCLSVCN